MEKTYPKVGEELFLRKFTGRYYIDMVKRPYTVIGVRDDMITVQECKLIYPMFEYDPEKMSDYYEKFDGKRVCFFDTVAEGAEPDRNGRIEELSWDPKREMWGSIDSNNPLYAVFGKYEHQPYID